MFKVILKTLLLATMLLPAVANAGPIYEFDSPGNSFTNGSWKFALNFRVLNTMTVTGLGYYADPQSGGVDNNAVALFDSQQNLLASVVVTNQYAIYDLFRYVTISQLVLGPGVYQIVGVSRGDNYTWNNVNHRFASGIEYVSNSWVQDSNGIASYVSGAQGDSSYGFAGPNMFVGTPDFTGTVPAPTTLILLGLGLIGLGMRRKQAK